MGSIGGSTSNYLSKSQQLNIILESNPAEDDIHTWIRSADDIMTFNEVWQDGTWDVDPDFTAEDVQKALDTGKITVYSSKPIVNGNFISPSAMEAAAYSGDQSIYVAEADVRDIAWIDETQGQVATKNKLKFRKISAKGLI